MEGEEATRETLVVWDALALKGSCHIWINGEGEYEDTGAVNYIMWDSAEAPESPVDGAVYYLLSDCPGINAGAVSGQMWQANKGDLESFTWSEYSGEVMV